VTPPAAKKPATPKSKPATPAAGKAGEEAAAAAAVVPAAWTCVRALEVREPGLPTSAVASIVTHEGKLYVGSRDHRIRCYDMDTWALLATAEQPEAVTTLHVHHMDGHADCLVSGCVDHRIRVWSLADLSLQCTLNGHTNGACTQHTRTATLRRCPDARVPVELVSRPGGSPCESASPPTQPVWREKFSLVRSASIGSDVPGALP